MQGLHHFIHEYTANAPENTVYATPEQIKVITPARHTEQSQNAIIRLAKSIRRYGILVPLEVRSAQDPPGYPATYELIDGERRLRAAILAGLDRIPCRILPENDKKCAVSAILAQLSSHGLHFFEQAAAFRMLMVDFALTQEEIARKSGFSQSAVANKLRLLALSKEEQTQIANAELTERHARALLRLKDPQARREALTRIRAARLNVAATDALIEDMTSACATNTEAPKTAPNALDHSQSAPFSVTLAPQKPPEGAIPRKFALQDLTPLYNSIERTLSIFRKTGANALCTREESREGVRIVITIPRENSKA